MTTPNRIAIGVVEHSMLGASGAHRWMNCVGSISLTNKILNDLSEEERTEFERPGEPASEGTAAHEVTATALRMELDAWEFIGTEVIADGREFVVDQEMAEGMQVHIDLVRGLMEEYAEQGARLYVENSMTSILDHEARGTADVVVFVPGVKIIVIDFKYGRGVVVEPDSAQNKYYGYLVCESFESGGIKDVDLYITQPRIPHSRGTVRRYSTTVKDLEDWFTSEVLPAMAATRDDDANLTIGNWCRFCPARDTCPALKGEVLNFDTSLEPDYLTDDELGDMLTTGDAIRKYLTSLGTEAFERLKKGATVPGYKLVYKRANRIFKAGGEAAIKKRFGDDAYEVPRFKTPPKIEKLEGGKKMVARWAFSPDTGFTVASDGDSRQAVRFDGEELFDSESTDV